MHNQNELKEFLNSSNSILNDSFSIPLEGKINYCKNNKKINNHSNINNNNNEFNINNNNNNNIHIIKNNKNNNNDNLFNQRTLISISTSTTSSLLNLSHINNNEKMNKTNIKKLKNNLNNKIIHPNKFIETNLIKNKINNIKILNNNNEHLNKNSNKIIPLKYAKKQYRRHSGFNHHKCDIDDCEINKKSKKNHKKNKKKKVNFKDDFIEIINVESWKSFNNLSFSKSINIKRIKNQYDCSCLIM